jgi:hypothetical protein
MTDHHSIHEGMDWGAVGLQKNDPREPAEMTVTKWKCPKKTKHRNEHSKFHFKSEKTRERSKYAPANS